MPRKPGLGPTILRIVALSTGRVVRGNKGLVDDFTGQPIEPIEDQSPIKPLLGADELKDITRRKARVEKRVLLEHVGILPMRSRPVPEQTVAVDMPGKRAIAIGSIALYVAKPSWRRL